MPFDNVLLTIEQMLKRQYKDLGKVIAVYLTQEEQQQSTWRTYIQVKI